MVKSILKRIIVGVAIALVLMLIKGNLLIQVHAEETTLRPSSASYFNTPYLDQEFAVSLSRGVFHNTTYNYFSLGASNYRALIRYYFDKPSKDYTNATITFLLLTYYNTSNQYEPYRAYIKDSKGHIYTCTVFSSNEVITTGTNAVTSLYNPVSCNNVNLKNDFAIYMGDNYRSQSSQSAYYGITDITINTNDVASAIQEQTDIIENDSVDTDKADADINSMKDKVASNGTITQLLTLPISLYQKILNSLNGTCSSINLGSLWGHNLTLTCINLQNILGSTLYNIIDILCCGLFILAFRKKMVDIFNHMTSLNDRGNELE